MSFWDFYSFIGKDIDPPGGLEFVVDNLYNNYLKKSKPFNYLDIASHTGLVSRTIAKFNLHNKIIGVDLSKSAIDRANYLCIQNNLKNIEFQHQDASNLSFTSNSFDFINAGISLGFFISNRNKCLKECHRLLTNNGKLFVNNLFYFTPPPKILKIRQK